MFLVPGGVHAEKITREAPGGQMWHAGWCALTGGGRLLQLQCSEPSAVLHDPLQQSLFWKQK